MPAWGEPARAPKIPTPMTAGTRTCIKLTPRLPRPALSPNEVPWTRLGKKKVMFDIDEAKAPPPTPERVARTTRERKETFGSWRAMPAPNIGTIRSREGMAMALRPPEMAIMKELGRRRVAPARPATAGGGEGKGPG